MRVALHHRERPPSAKFLDRAKVVPRHHQSEREGVSKTAPRHRVQPASVPPGVGERGPSGPDGPAEQRRCLPVGRGNGYPEGSSARGARSSKAAGPPRSREPHVRGRS